MISLGYSDKHKTTPINFPVFLICLIFIRAFVYFFLDDSLSIDKILEELFPTVFLILLFVIAAVMSLKHYSFTEKHLIVRFLGVPVKRIDWRSVSHAVYAKQWRINKGKLKYKFAASAGKGNAIFISLYGCPPYDPEHDALTDFSIIDARNLLCIHIPSKTAEEYVDVFRSCYPDLVIAPGSSKD